MNEGKHQGALPTYLRIAEHLTIEIGAGRLGAGDKLPTERSMAANFGVSMTTLRKALDRVTERGLIERRHGAGNFVRGGKRNIGTYALFRLELIEGGGLPTAEVIDFQRKPSTKAPHHMRELFEWGWRIRRVRSLSYTPVAVEEVWLDTSFGTLTRGDLSESLYKSYSERLNLTITHAEDRLSVAPLPHWAAPHLGLVPEHPMGLVKRRSFNQYGEPAEASITWYDPALAQYYARVP